MMRTITGLLALGAASLACSGRYEVGGMNESSGGGTVGAAGPSVRGPAGGVSSGGAGPAGSSTMGVAGAGGPVDEFGATCVPLGAPAELTGQFAEPQVVWSRLTLLIWGKQMPPPSAYPATTTYAWAGDLVTQAFTEANAELAAVPGARLFVSHWLFHSLTVEQRAVEEPVLDHSWETALAGDAPAVETLLVAPAAGGEARFGVFTERSWLQSHRNIASRGAGIADILFQRGVPPPPSSVNMQLSSQSTERAALEAAISQPVCTSCHSMMNPLGFALGKFGPDGELRAKDNGFAIDTTGSYNLRTTTIQYDGILGFGQEAARTCDAALGVADGFLMAALVINQLPADLRSQLLEANRARVRQAFVRSRSRSYADLVRAYAQSELGLRP